MSNKQNLVIADNIMEEVQNIHFIRLSDRLEYARKWYQAVIESEQGNIFKAQPPIFTIQPMTRDQLLHEEQKFINSFSE